MALCRAMGAGPEELLLPLVQAVERQLAGRLREGAEDCGSAFPLAAAMTAVELLSAMTGGGDGVTSFTAGELTIRREQGGTGRKGLSTQAEGLLAPWLGDTGFMFQGAEG